MRWLILFLFLSSSLFAQQKFGIELRSTVNTTLNAKNEIGNDIDFSSGVIIQPMTGTIIPPIIKQALVAERSQVDFDYSLGIIFFIDPNNTIKLHVGRHNISRSFIIEGEDLFGNQDRYEMRRSFSLLQINPSYTYLFRYRRLILPLELGMAFNKNTKGLQGPTFNDWLVESRVAFGIEYITHDTFAIGSNLVYAHALQDIDNRLIRSVFRPYQIGLELNIKYYFSISIGDGGSMQEHLDENEFGF